MKFPVIGWLKLYLQEYLTQAFCSSRERRDRVEFGWRTREPPEKQSMMCKAREEVHGLTDSRVLASRFWEHKDGTSRWRASPTFGFHNWKLWLCEEREGRQGLGGRARHPSSKWLVAHVPREKTDKIQGGFLTWIQCLTKGVFGQ